MKPSSNWRFAGWVAGFVVTLVVFQLVASVHPRSVPWIAVSLIGAGLVGAALLSLFEWLRDRFDDRG